MNFYLTKIILFNGPLKFRNYQPQYFPLKYIFSKVLHNDGNIKYPHVLKELCFMNKKSVAVVSPTNVSFIKVADFVFYLSNFYGMAYCSNLWFPLKLKQVTGAEYSSKESTITWLHHNGTPWLVYYPVVTFTWTANISLLSHFATQSRMWMGSLKGQFQCVLFEVHQYNLLIEKKPERDYVPWLSG